MGLQAVLWLQATSAAHFSTRRLSFISLGAALTILGTVVVREARRLAAIDVTQSFAAHSEAAHAGGMGVFFICFALSASVIAACILIVRRALRALQ
jgi:hypothetical protein